MNLLEALLNAFRLPELRNKLLITAGLLAGYRLLANVSIPGASQQALDALFNGQQILNLLNLFSGGGLAQFSVVALGVTPYINASIIMQLMTVVSERLKQMQKEGGDIGRRRFTRWTRYLTVALAFLQSYGITVVFQNTSPPILQQMDWFQRISIMLIMTCGTAVAMWLGELISEYGIGNGISLIIFAGILARSPQAIYGTIVGNLKGGGLADYLPLIILTILGVLAIAFIIEIQQAVRKVPIQSAQRLAGGRTVKGRQSFLPLRLNTAGVIPIIFALSVIYLPQMVATYLRSGDQSKWYVQVAGWIVSNFSSNGSNLWMVITFNLIYFLLIFGFTFFYTSVTFDVHDVADNLRRNSSFIPGIRPGEPTAQYLGMVLNRITLVGGLFLGLITVVLPILAAKVSSIPQQQLSLGGAGLLIVVGVALDTMRQLETQLVMRQYRGFIR